MHITLLLLSLLGSLQLTLAQTYSISGSIMNASTGQAAPEAEVLLVNNGSMLKASSKGHFIFKDIPEGTYSLTAYSIGLGSQTQQVTISNADVTLHFSLKPLEGRLNEVNVNGERIRNLGISRLNSVEGTAIYEAKKSEVVIMSDITANLATNNSRQVFAKVAGLNIWESDGAGLQLGIGGRGLSPNRTSNFNTRQNGYDISADALGYPESYYTPASEALERIEVVRGAASLQYGTQFGGMLNFVMKEGSEDKPFELVSRQTGGSFGLFNSFNSIGGHKGKVHYYGYYQYKRGDGWRPNSGFNVHTAYGNLHYQPTNNLEIKLDYTYMTYLAQQPGGLTDAAFVSDPRQSVRDRNWFEVNWNLLSLSLDYRLGERTKMNVRNFGLLAERNALGYLEKINRPDPMLERLLLKDRFRNFGNEMRLIHRYEMQGNSSTVLVGTRYYNGFTDQQQGNGTDGSDADFRYYPNHNNPSISDYDYPSRNLSVFAENIFNLTPKFSITPGIRYEWINTKADGRYDIVNKDQAGNILHEERVEENRTNTRGLVLFGLGLSYKKSDNLEFYSNFSQNYRAINFNDMRIVNANIRIDQNLQDEKGHSTDLGVRGGIADVVNFDLSFFNLVYDNRIGLRPQKDEMLYINYLLRTNIGKSRNRGVETFAETDVLKLLYGSKHPTSLSVFSNLTFVNAVYLIKEEVSVIRK